MKSYECSLVDIAPTISKILNIPMVPPDGTYLKEVVEYAKEHECQKAVIIIVDSLGCSLYRYYIEIMPYLRGIAESGILLRCRSTADYTTPAIASIFTGYYPEEHHIYATDDIYVERAKDASNPKIKSILEWAQEAGRKSSVVIESRGADSFLGRVIETFGVPDSKDIIEYDKKISDAAAHALENNPDVLAVHLRAIDRYAHRATTWKEMSYAVTTIDENIGQIFSNAEKGTLFFICGDHPIHAAEKWLKSASFYEIESYKNRLVPLIIGSS
ncbi:MAG: alkaline phosphatase family protein [Methanosarcinaceae archaeon]|nr:alkaline phosphatase family protein [Methanosarcinaceae archaeon]